MKKSTISEDEKLTYIKNRVALSESEIALEFHVDGEMFMDELINETEPEPTCKPDSESKES